MEFGLWVEPEMINLDSHLARAHPDWVLSTGDRIPISSRQQQVLDLGKPAAYEYILESLDALLTEYRISYLKWDHNRDLIDSGHAPSGHPAVHDQTVAVYALMDELRARHPGLEIESCSSGGGRVDLEVLQHTDRIWTSDCIDALERQTIQRYTGLMVPPELMGAHIGSDRSHTTGRRHDLSFRAGTALFGHMGIEADLSKMSADERAELAAWVSSAQAAPPPAALREHRSIRPCRPLVGGPRRHRRRPERGDRQRRQHPNLRQRTHRQARATRVESRRRLRRFTAATRKHRSAATTTNCPLDHQRDPPQRRRPDHAGVQLPDLFPEQAHPAARRQAV